MNRKIPLLLFTVFALVSCAKTEKLYGANEYNSPIFDENYYTDWDGIDSLGDKIESKESISPSNLKFSSSAKFKFAGDDTEYIWSGDKEEEFGYNHNLSDIEKKFSYGVTSKLFDGRVRCEGLYQKSRVQLDKTGFAMFFPKQLIKATKYLGFACRGGTDFPDQRFAKPNLKVDFNWSFYIHQDNGKYAVKTFAIHNAEIPVDNGGNTAFVYFQPYLPEDYFYEISGAVGMSLTWQCVDESMSLFPVTDDYTDKEKNHLSLMLYEVFIGDNDSIWN